MDRRTVHTQRFLLLFEVQTFLDRTTALGVVIVTRTLTHAVNIVLVSTTLPDNV
jgi:hypothetical protein